MNLISKFIIKKVKNPSICFVSHSSGNAGAERAFPKLLEGLKSQGLEIHVLLPGRGPVIKDLEIRHIPYAIIPYTRWSDTDSRPIKKIKRTIKNLVAVIPMIIKILQWKCNLVYTNTSTIFSSALASKLIGLPHIWHFREFGFEDYGYKFDLGIKLSQWIINRFSSLCLVNSNAVAQKYKMFIPEGMIKVLYESYKDDEYIRKDKGMIQIQKSSLNCIMVGTLHKTKGYEDAIQAVSCLVSDRIDVKLFIIGEGLEDYKKYLLELIGKFKLETHVEFLGYQENPKFFMRQCDVLLMCSKNEAYGLVTLEAMQTGKPVIGSKSGGTLELIIDEFNGLFYTPGDFIELAEKIKYLYLNPNKLQEMGKNAEEWAIDKFKPEKYIKATLDVIKKVCKYN